MSEKGAHRFASQFKDPLLTRNGAVGKIVSVSLPTFIVKEPSHIEKTIMITASTTIRAFKVATSSGALIPDTYVAIIGSPKDNAIIEARFIGILLAPPTH